MSTIPAIVSPKTMLMHLVRDYAVEPPTNEQMALFTSSMPVKLLPNTVALLLRGHQDMPRPPIVAACIAKWLSMNAPVPWRVTPQALFATLRGTRALAAAVRQDSVAAVSWSEGDSDTPFVVHEAGLADGGHVVVCVQALLPGGSPPGLNAPPDCKHMLWITDEPIGRAYACWRVFPATQWVCNLSSLVQVMDRAPPATFAYYSSWLDYLCLRTVHAVDKLFEDQRYEFADGTAVLKDMWVVLDTATDAEAPLSVAVVNTAHLVVRSSDDPNPTTPPATAVISSFRAALRRFNGPFTADNHIVQLSMIEARASERFVVRTICNTIRLETRLVVQLIENLKSMNG